MHICMEKYTASRLRYIPEPAYRDADLITYTVDINDDALGAFCLYGSFK